MVCVASKAKYRQRSLTLCAAIESASIEPSGAVMRAEADE